MGITKTLQFNQTLSVNKDDGGASNYASFNGTVDDGGVPAVNYYIGDDVLYKENLKSFRDAWSTFQDTVFAEADKVVASFEKQWGRVMNFFPHDIAGWLTVVGSLSGAMWFVIQNTFVKSMNDLNKAINGLQETLKIYDHRLDDHETRIRLLEDWREHHDDNE